MKKRGRWIDMKKLMVIVFIIFGAFLTLCLYRTYAYDTSVVEEVPSTTDLEYTFKIGNSSIKQITVDSGETRYYDIVLGNPNNAKISYSVYYEMISPSTKPDDYKIEYTFKSTGNSTGIVNNNGNITLNIVVTNTSSSAVTVKLGTVAGYVKGGELLLGSGQEVIPRQPVLATNLIKALTDNTTGDNGSGVYKIEHESLGDVEFYGDDTMYFAPVTNEIMSSSIDYRYYGPSPNNYICLDMEGSSTCPDKNLYRIIGSMYDELEGADRTKVVKATVLTDNNNVSGWSFDYKSDGTYSNMWAQATDTRGTLDSSIQNNYSDSLTSGSTLMQLLNSGAWWNSTTGIYYNYSSDGVISTNVDFRNLGPNSNVKKYIQKSRYYINNYEDGFQQNLNLYYIERARTDDYSLYWEGYVGLPYISDYGYAAGINCFDTLSNSAVKNVEECNGRTWLNYQNIQYPLLLYYVYDTKHPWILYSNTLASIPSDAFWVQPSLPSFYLTSNTLITNGDGSIDNPYLIGL